MHKRQSSHKMNLLKSSTFYSANPGTLALYIHVPFCVSRCNYCDFYTNACSPTDAMVDDFFSTLKAQIYTTAKMKQYQDKILSSIYFGGGTPSHVYAHLPEALATVKQAFLLSDDCEISF